MLINTGLGLGLVGSVEQDFKEIIRKGCVKEEIIFVEKINLYFMPTLDIKQSKLKQSLQPIIFSFSNNSTPVPKLTVILISILSKSLANTISLITHC
jgi:hypothetical protein